MEIKGNFTVQVTGIQMRADKKNDGQQILVDADLTLNAEEAEKYFGEGFAFVAFAGMRNTVVGHDDGDETVTQFGYSSKKPPKWLRPSVHHVDLWGVKDKTQPEILSIIAGDNVELVTVKLRFVIDANADEARIGKLGAMVGKQAKIKLKPEKAAAFPAAAPTAKGNGAVATIGRKRRATAAASPEQAA